MALSTNQKIAVAVGVTAAIALVGFAAFAKPKSIAPPPRPKGLNFETRNLDALNAVVSAMLADPKLSASALNQFADQLSNYGLYDQELKLRAKANPQLQLQLASTAVSSGSMNLITATGKR